ncbi:MAG: class I SAM-dependent methyltransferase [Elusimicrobiota bacterium]
MKARTCRLCDEAEIAPLLDLGPQPLCNRYLAGKQADEYTHPLRLWQCPACGLVQLDEPAPAAELRSRFDWITYREVEGHLDDLADVLSRLPGITPQTRFCGVTYKDDPLLQRLRQRGFERCWRIDPKNDLDVEDPLADVETIQERLTPAAAHAVGRAHGRPDVVIARHILEHTHDTLGFMAGLKALAAPDGYVVCEVPACERLLEQGDYTALWEEHVLYLTAETLRRSVSSAGLSLVELKTYPHFPEDILVVIAGTRPGPAAAVPAGGAPRGELIRASAFARGFPKTRRQFREFLGDQARRGTIALFGAGHRSAMFINLLELKDLIGFVVDDDPNKRGLLMPGSQLAILDSAALREKNAKLCLLVMGPESETKVVEKNRLFTEQGGTFASIFPGSPYAPKSGFSGRA